MVAGMQATARLRVATPVFHVHSVPPTEFQRRFYQAALSPYQAAANPAIYLPPCNIPPTHTLRRCWHKTAMHQEQARERQTHRWGWWKSQHATGTFGPVSAHHARHQLRCQLLLLRQLLVNRRLRVRRRR